MVSWICTTKTLYLKPLEIHIQLIQIPQFFEVITQGQGTTKKSEVNFPTGKKTSSIDIYSRTYKSPNRDGLTKISVDGKGDAYTATLSNYENPTMVASSSIIGLIEYDCLLDCDPIRILHGSVQGLMV